MRRVLRFAAFGLLMVIGIIAGVLLKRETVQDHSAETDEKVTRTSIASVGRQFTATPTLPHDTIPPVRHTMRVHKPRYHPRDPLEWQGMRVDVSMQANCESSKQCGLAMACHSGTCGPCKRDDECATGEGCVLDHCLIRSRIGCRSRHDCATDELCVLSGYSADARSNRDLTARCLAAVGGTRQKPEKLTPRETVPAKRTPVRVDEMRRDLHKALP